RGGWGGEGGGGWFGGEVGTAAGSWRTGLARLHPQWRIEGAWPADGGAGEDAVVPGRALARELGLRVGDTLTVRAGGRSGRLAVRGIVDAGGLDDRRLWLPLPTAQRLAARPGEIDRVAFSALVKPETRQAPPDAAH